MQRTPHGDTGTASDWHSLCDTRGRSLRGLSASIAIFNSSRVKTYVAGDGPRGDFSSSDQARAALASEGTYGARVIVALNCLAWLYGGGDEVKLVAQYGGGSNFGGEDPDIIRQETEVLKRHCEAAGREYDAITKSTSNNLLLLESGVNRDRPLHQFSREVIPQFA